MKKVIFIIFVILILILSGMIISLNIKKKNINQLFKNIHINNMKITSTAFANKENIPEKYTCRGKDTNPPLTISEVPENAKSLVLVLEDPDAPKKPFWLHWTVWNIDPTITQIEENSVPSGAQQGTTDAADVGYHGPCPPSGTHRYYFKLYALDTLLTLPEGGGYSKLMDEMKGHIIAEAELMGIYGQ